MSGYYPVFVRNRGRRPIEIVAQFTVNAAGAPTIVSHDSLDAAGLLSAVHTATGKYTFVSLDGFSRILGVEATYSSAVDNEDLYAQPDGGALNATTGVATVIVRTKAAAVNTDPSANTNLLTIRFRFEN